MRILFSPQLAGLVLLADLPLGSSLAAFAAAPRPAALPTRRPAQVGKDGGPTGAFTYSADPAVAARQRVVKGIIERYQQHLNTSNTAAILPMFAPNTVVEWNTKRTVVGRDNLKAPYQQLFQVSKFSTQFQYDAVDLHDNVALVRTHHPKGQAEVNVKTGAKTLDFNRELFILKNTGGTTWQIIFYSFNAQPQQGEQ